MDQGQIIKKPENHTKELQPYFACNRERLEVFMLWYEKVNVNMCKILFTQSISEAQILQVKHITGRKTYSKSRYKSFFGGKEGSEQ